MPFSPYSPKPLGGSHKGEWGWYSIKFHIESNASADADTKVLQLLLLFFLKGELKTI